MNVVDLVNTSLPLGITDEDAAERFFQLPHLDPAITLEPTGVGVRCYCNPQGPVPPLNVACRAKVSWVVGQDSGAWEQPC